MPHVKRTRNASVRYPPLPGGLSNCRGARSHGHLDSLTRVAGRLTHVLGDGGDDANRTSYRWPARLRGSGGAHTSSNEGKNLPERVHDNEAEEDFSINNNDQEQQLKLMSLRAPHTAAISRMPEVEVARGLVPYTCCRFRKGSNERGASSSEGRPPFRW